MRSLNSLQTGYDAVNSSVLIVHVTSLCCTLVGDSLWIVDPWPDKVLKGVIKVILKG